MILIVNAHFVWILRKKLPLWNPARCGIQVESSSWLFQEKAFFKNLLAGFF
eukprot:COSAG02_NODE_339_length_24201_cov_45.538462_3_plen_51_part_00